MNYRWLAPLDPDCPVVRKYEDTLFDDPMTEAMGAPTDDIMRDFTRSHRVSCTRCQEYGLANIGVSHG